MLTHSIRDQFLDTVKRVSNESGVEKLTTKQIEAQDDVAARVPGVVFSVTASKWIQNEILREEMFGPATLLVECEDENEMIEVAKVLDGQLTASVFGSIEDIDTTKSELSRTLCDRVGRLIFNDWPTGVEVCDAMVHGVRNSTIEFSNLETHTHTHKFYRVRIQPRVHLFIQVSEPHQSLDLHVPCAFKIFPNLLFLSS